jgi:uncharacterized protein (DUF2267 family)
MSPTGLDVFDRTLHVTNTWLEEIMAEHGPDRQVAWHILSAVLHAVKDQLPLELAVQFGAQSPLLVQGLYYDQWHFVREPDRDRSLEHFLDHAGYGLTNIRPINRSDAVRTVFCVLSHHMAEGQIEKIRNALPHEVRVLWPFTRG